MSKDLCIVLIGAPCSGKSTIGKEVANRINAQYISSGNIARKMAEMNSDINDSLNAGKLAPENEMRSAISYEINNTCNDTIILDGFPRFDEQAKWLYENFDMDIRYVAIETPLHTLIDRARHRGRMDDDSFIDRYAYYIEVTKRDLYEHIEYKIDGSLPINECVELLMQYICSINIEEKEV